MNENESIVLITAMVLIVAVIYKFLDFVAGMADVDSEAKESAWDDEL